MEKLPFVLKPNGRAAILTFHSGEDRLVKKTFQQFYREGVYQDIAKDVDPSVAGGMHPKQPGALDEAALGDPGRRITWHRCYKKTL